MANVENLRATIQAILANPQHWNQGTWHCGPSHCFAGFAEMIRLEMEPVKQCKPAIDKEVKYLEVRGISTYSATNYLHCGLVSESKTIFTIGLDNWHYALRSDSVVKFPVLHSLNHAHAMRSKDKKSIRLEVTGKERQQRTYASVIQVRNQRTTPDEIELCFQ